MNVKSIKNCINWCRKNPIKTIIIVVLLILIGLLIANLSGEHCRPCFIKNLGITETSKFCNPGTLIVRLGYAIGGVIALLVAVASFERVRALDQTARAQEKGNIEDRYKNAISQLGKENSSIRLAGAYGLYHLARDNEDRRRNICDVLCVHIRGITTSKKLILNNESYSEIYKAKPSDEVQSILDLLTNKNYERDFPFKSDWINLENAHLNGANLREAQLQRANLKRAQLQKADLGKAHLQDADLEKAYLQEANLVAIQFEMAKLSFVHLEKANLERAQLQGAELNFVHLEKANLERAQFQGANLVAAYLRGTILLNAQFQGANLKEAQLQGAVLSNTQFQGVNLWRAQLQGAYLQRAQLQGAILFEAQFQGANLYETQLQSAYLGATQFQGASLGYAQLQGANLSFAEFQGANLEKANFSGAFTEKDIGIDSAVELLNARKNKKDEIKNVIFSGGVTVKQLKNFREKRADIEKVLVDIKYDRINYFKERMNKVEKILKDNINKPIDTSIPPEAITGVYPKAEADEVIAMLQEINRV